MTETLTSLEVSAPVAIEVKTTTDLVDQDIQDLTELVNAESEKVMESPKIGDWKPDWKAAFVQLKAVDFLKNALKTNSDSSVIFAKDQLGKLLGYSIVVIGENGVKDTYIGVRRDERNQGIGGKLLEERVKHLKAMGIEGYTAKIRSDALRLYDRLKIPYTDITEKSTNDDDHIIRVDISERLN